MGGPSFPKFKSGDCCVGLWPNDDTWYNVKIIEVRHDCLSARVVFTDYLNLDILPLTNLYSSLAEVGAERLKSVDRYLSGQGEDKGPSSEPAEAGGVREGLMYGLPTTCGATRKQIPEATSPARLYGSLCRPTVDTPARGSLARTLKLKTSLVIDSVPGPMFLALLPS